MPMADDDEPYSPPLKFATVSEMATELGNRGFVYVLLLQRQTKIGKSNVVLESHTDAAGFRRSLVIAEAFVADAKKRLKRMRDNDEKED